MEPRERYETIPHLDQYTIINRCRNKNDLNKLRFLASSWQLYEFKECKLALSLEPCLIQSIEPNNKLFKVLNNKRKEIYQRTHWGCLVQGFRSRLVYVIVYVKGVLLLTLFSPFLSVFPLWFAEKIETEKGKTRLKSAKTRLDLAAPILKLFCDRECSKGFLFFNFVRPVFLFHVSFVWLLFVKRSIE